MGEEAVFSDDELEENEIKKFPKKKAVSDKPKCRSRLEQLALPGRRLILDLWQKHAYHLPKDKVEHVKVLLQELYAMTPEETEKYFALLQKEEKKKLLQKSMKDKLNKLLHKQRRQQQQRQAYKFFFELLCNGIGHALKSPIPPLVSVRLRNLSDIVLEQICDLREVQVPQRTDSDKLSTFLISISDWIAIVVEHLYYNIQIKKNMELIQIEEAARQKQAIQKNKTLETKISGVQPILFTGEVDENDDELMTEIE